MREQFPALCHALGEPLFNDFVAEYIRERPPESHTLYDLGRRFPAFLDESRPDRDQPPEEREAWIDFMVDLGPVRAADVRDVRCARARGKAVRDARDARRPAAPAALPSRSAPIAFPSPRTITPSARSSPPSCRRPRRASRRWCGRDYVTRTIVLSELDYLFLKAMVDGGGVDGGDRCGGAASRGIAGRTVRRSWASEQGSRRRWIDWRLLHRSSRSSGPRASGSLMIERIHIRV